ncbi:MAG: site-specific DNA-methyltransferase [Butyrivibrio crossotus]|nr:site-specific DNA-methyltransferase [Butyrivibrio crossotus]
MDKLKMKTENIADKNYEVLSKMFPNALTETITGYDDDGKPIVERAIDADVLRQEISCKVVEGKDERYQFTWPDKKKTMALSNEPISLTLRPNKDKSVNFQNTQNIYIEGDNLDVLKILQETYLDKIKLIYIDPPYNTGNDFVYNDDFSDEEYQYIEKSGQNDSVGNRLVANTETNGRFHTDWLNMMYARMRIARNLLASDGAIFISIDDNESMNLVKMMDEIFGDKNRIALICHKSRASISNDKIISPNHNTILFYAKDISKLEEKRKMIGLDPVLEKFDCDDNDGRGEYRLVPVDGPGGAKKGNPHYEFLGVEGYWRFSKETMKAKYDEGYVVKKGNSLYQKYYKSVAEQTRRTTTTWWDDAGLTSSATSKLKKIMGETTFDTPKPVELIDRMLRMITFDDPEAIVLDFFAGSSTTAQAVMEYNAENNGKRKFILVQLPESVSEKTEAYENGYRNICEIGEKRIKKVIDNIDNRNIDLGFRVFELDSSNMKDIYYTPSET